MVEISAVMPAFNEQENIEKAIDKINTYLKNKFRDFEIIVVNDGSTDGTGKILNDLARKNLRLKVLNNKHNLGYGAAVWKGLRKARGELVFFTDSDMQFDIRELGRFLKKIKSCDLVIGFRKKRSEGAARAFNAWGWRLVCRLLLGIRFKDIDCAFKLIKREYLRKIKIVSTGAAFSAELLYKLQRKGARICQLPVKHFKRKSGNPTGAKLPVIYKGLNEIYSFYLSQKNLVKNRSIYIYIGAIIVLFITRFVFFSNSADFFDSNQYIWRTASTSTLEAISHGHPPFHPLYLFFSNLSYKYLVKDVVLAATLPAIILGSLSIVWVFLIVKKLFSNRIAWLVSLLYAFNPFIFISQITILIDPVMHSFFFLSLYLFLQSIEDKGSKYYLKTIGSGLALGLAVFTHTQIAFWMPAYFSVFLIANKNYSREKILKLFLSAVIILAGVIVFILLYLKLLIYSNSVGYVNMEVFSWRDALEFLLFGNAGDRESIKIIVFIRKIISIFSLSILISAFLGGIFLLIKRKYTILLGLLLWIAPGFIASFYIYENLHGRAMMVMFVPVFILASLFIVFLKGRLRIAVAIIIMVQTLVAGVAVANRYRTEASANDQLALAQKLLSSGGIFISSNVTKTWNSFDGEFVNFGDVDVGAGKVVAKVEEVLNLHKPVYITQNAIRLPYRRYDGMFYDIRSDIRRKPYENSTMLTELFKKYSVLPRSPLDGNFYDYIYEVKSPKELTDINSIGNLLDKGDLVFGRLQVQGKPVSMATVNVMENQFCQVSRDNIVKYDFIKCVMNIIRNRGEIESWSLSDTNGYFFVKTNINDPRIQIGFNYQSNLVSMQDKVFLKDSVIKIDSSECTDITSLDEIKKRMDKSEDSYLASSIGLNKFKLCKFKIGVNGSDRLEGERMSGESEIIRNKSASNGYVISNKSFSKSGFLNGGPYIDLKKGNYKISFRILSYNNLGSINIDATTDTGKQIIATKRIDNVNKGEFAVFELDINLGRDYSGLEFRVNAQDGAKVGLDYIEVIRL